MLEKWGRESRTASATRHSVLCYDTGGDCVYANHIHRRECRKTIGCFRARVRSEAAAVYEDVVLTPAGEAADGDSSDCFTTIWSGRKYHR